MLKIIAIRIGMSVVFILTALARTLPGTATKTPTGQISHTLQMLQPCPLTGTKGEGVKMDRGYVKIWRKIFDSQVGVNFPLFMVFVWCITRAAYKETWVGMKTGKGKTQVHLMPGQFIFGRESAAKSLGMKPSTVRDRMEKLKNMGNIDIQSDRQYSIITIKNWELYQSDDKEVRKALKAESDRQKDSQPTGNRQATDTKKHLKNIKERKDIYSRLFDFWNEQKIIVHKQINSDMEKAMEKLLYPGNGHTPYEPKEIATAMKNYGIVVNGDEYFFSYKWSLIDFISGKKGQNLEKFLDINDPLTNFLRDKDGGEGKGVLSAREKELAERHRKRKQGESHGRTGKDL
jgi:hypothetical protein